MVLTSVVRWAKYACDLGLFHFRCDFLSVVTTFCMMGPEEVVKYTFCLFDRDKNGFLDQQEVDHMVEMLHHVRPVETMSFPEPNLRCIRFLFRNACTTKIKQH